MCGVGIYQVIIVINKHILERGDTMSECGDVDSSTETSQGGNMLFTSTGEAEVLQV